MYPEPTHFNGPEQVTVLRDPARVYLLTNAMDTKIEVTDETKKKDHSKRKPKTDKRGDVAFRWSHTRDETGWSDNTAGDLQFLSGKVLAEKQSKLYGHLKNVQQVPTVVLNENFKDWATYRNRVLTKRGDSKADLRTTKYGVAVGSAAAVICGGEFERRKQKEDGKPVDPMTTEQEQ